MVHANDVEFASNCDIVVADGPNHRICVYSADGSTLLRTFGGEGRAPGMFKHPIALSSHRTVLYVLEEGSPRVQVYQ